MLDDILLPLFTDFFGKSIYVTAEEVTGVSQKIWRKGGPKRVRKLNDVKENTRAWLYRTIEKKNEFPRDELPAKVNEILKKQDEYTGVLSSFFWGTGEQCSYEWNETKLLAEELDGASEELGVLIKNKDVITFKQKIVSLLEVKDVHTWLSTIEQGFVKNLENAKSASELKELDTVLSCWLVQAIFRFLACWDVEFQYKFLSNANGTRCFEPMPLLSYLLPRLNPKRKINADGTCSLRGVFHLPMRHLLILTFSLAHYYRDQKWPKKHQLKTNYISGWIAPNPTTDTAQLMKKIFRGTKGITAQEFDAMWVSMTCSSCDPI